MKAIKNRLPLIFLALLLTKTITVSAQTDMHKMHHNTSGFSKNIYLLMMDTMMVKMDDIPSAISPESDFLYQMIPHHNGAIAMALYEISHGKNFKMVQLAKSILAEQQSEVQQMSLWLKKSLTKVDVLDHYKQEMGKSMMVMMETMPDNTKLQNVDQAFAMVMIPHHQAAIDMAGVLIKYAKDPTLTAYGNLLISNEQIEIEQMKEFLK